MNKKSVSFDQRSVLITSIVLLVIVIGGFLYMWFSFARPDASAFKSSENLTAVDVSKVESGTKKILEGLKNNGSIPISTPTSKMGRQDPFASL